MFIVAEADAEAIRDTSQQEQMRSAMQKTMGNLVSFGNVEEMARQNIAIMERASSLFTPFYRTSETGGAEGIAVVSVIWTGAGKNKLRPVAG